MIEASKENVAHDNGRRVGDVVDCAELPSNFPRIDNNAFGAHCSISQKYTELHDDVQFPNCPDSEISFGISGCSFGLPYNDHNYAVEYTGAGSPPLPTYEEYIRKSPLALRELGSEDFQSPPTIPVRLRSQSVGGASGIGSVISQCNTSQVVVDSIIRCVCQYTHDDGKMVQCSKCSVWQHFDCLSTDIVAFDKNVPHDCESCSPRSIDYRRALEIQRKKRASCQTTSLHNSFLAQHVRRLAVDPSKTHTIVVNASTVTSCPRQFIVTTVANDKGNSNNVNNAAATTNSSTSAACVGRVSKRKQTLAMRNTGSSPPDTVSCSAPLTPTGEDRTAVVLSRGQSDELHSSKLMNHPQGSAPSRPSGLPSPTRPQWHNLVSPPTIVGHPVNKCVSPGQPGSLPQARPSYVYPIKSCRLSLASRTKLSNMRTASTYRPSQPKLFFPTNTSTITSQRRARDRSNSFFESSDIDDDSESSDHQSSPRLSSNMSGRSLSQKDDRDYRSNGKFVLCQRVIMREEREHLNSSLSSEEDDIWLPPPKLSEFSETMTLAMHQFRRTMTAWMQREYQEADQMVYSNEVEKLLLRHNEHGMGENQADGRIRERLKLKQCRVVPLNARLKIQKQNGEYQDATSPTSRLTSPPWRVLEATHSLRKYDTVIEFKGRMLLKSEYEKETDQSRNFNPFVLFYEGFGGPDLCLNASNYGNDARFIRRSCYPNCDIGHLTESGRLHLIVRALCDIPIGTELTIGFDFDYKLCPYMECACELPYEECPVRQHTLNFYEIQDVSRHQQRPRNVFRRKHLKSRLPSKSSDVTELLSRKCEPSTSKIIRPRERSLSRGSWYNRTNDYDSGMSNTESSFSSCTDTSDVEGPDIHLNVTNRVQIPSPHDKDLDFGELSNEGDNIYENPLHISPPINNRQRNFQGKQDPLLARNRKSVLDADSPSSSCSASDAESHESRERGVSPFRMTIRQRNNQPLHSPRSQAPVERPPSNRVLGRQPRVKTTVTAGGPVHQRRFTDPLPKTPKAIKTYTPRREQKSIEKSKTKLPGFIAPNKRRGSNDSNSRLSSVSKDTEAVVSESSQHPVATGAGDDDSNVEASTKENYEKGKHGKKSKEMDESDNFETTPRKMSRDDRWLAAVMRRIEEQESGVKRRRPTKAALPEPTASSNISVSVNGDLKKSPSPIQATSSVQEIVVKKEESDIEFDDGSTDPMEDSEGVPSCVSDNETDILAHKNSTSDETKPLQSNEVDLLSPKSDNSPLTTIKTEEVENTEGEKPLSCLDNESRILKTEDPDDLKPVTSAADEVVKSEEAELRFVEKTLQPEEQITQPEPVTTPDRRRRKSSTRASELDSSDKQVESENADITNVESENHEELRGTNSDQSKPDRWLRIALARIETEEKMNKRRQEREERRKKKQDKTDCEDPNGKSTENLNKKNGSDRERSNSSIVENDESCPPESITDPVEVIMKEVDAETGESNPTSLGGVLESASVPKDENALQEISEPSPQQTPTGKRRRSNRRISPGTKSNDVKDEKEKACASSAAPTLDHVQTEDSSFCNDGKANVDSDSSSGSLSSDEASQDEEDIRSSTFAPSPSSQLAGGRGSSRQLRSSVGIISVGLDTTISLSSRGRQRGRPRRTSGGRASIDCVTAPNIDANDSSPGKNASEHCCDRIVYVNPSQKNPLERFARHKSQIDGPVTQMEVRDIHPASEPPTPAPVSDVKGLPGCNSSVPGVGVTDTPTPLKKRWRNYSLVDRSPIVNASPQEPLLPPMKKRRLNFPSDEWQDLDIAKKNTLKSPELSPLKEEVGPIRETKSEITMNVTKSPNGHALFSSTDMCDKREHPDTPVISTKMSSFGNETNDDSLPNHPINIPRKKLYLMHYEQERLQMKLNEDEVVKESSENTLALSPEGKETLHSDSVQNAEAEVNGSKAENADVITPANENDESHARLLSALIHLMENRTSSNIPTEDAETKESGAFQESVDPPVGPRTPSEPDEAEERIEEPLTPASAEEWNEAQVSENEGADDEVETKSTHEDEEDEMMKEAQLLKRIHERDKQIMDMQELKSLERRKAKLEAQLRYIGGKESAESTENTRPDQGTTSKSAAVQNDIVRFTNHLKDHLERLKSQLNQPAQSGGTTTTQARDLIPSTSAEIHRDKSPSPDQDKARSRSRSPLSPIASHPKTPASDGDSSDSSSSNSSTLEQTRRHRHRHHGSHKKRRHHRSTHRHRHRSKHKRKHRRHRRDSTPHSSPDELTSNVNKGPKDIDLTTFDSWEGTENDEEEIESDDQIRFWNSESSLRRHYVRDGGIRNCHFEEDLPDEINTEVYFDRPPNAEGLPFVRRYHYHQFTQKMSPLNKTPEFHRTWHPGLRGGIGNRYRRRRPFQRHGPSPAAAPMPGQWETLPSPGLQHLQSVPSLSLQSQSAPQQHQLPTQQQQPPPQQPSLPGQQLGRVRPVGRGGRGGTGRHRGTPGLHRGAVGPSAANIRQYYGGNLASHRNWHHNMF